MSEKRAEDPTQSIAGSGDPQSGETGGSASGAASVELSGGKIGPYELIRKMGEGGMGTVFEARQTGSLHRRVAVKVIKSQLRSKEITDRFNSERQVLALMEHPHIARVFDAGATQDDTPYFVMEFVEGLAIDRYCDQQSLSLRQRIELFIDVCSGVHHAHQKGILHRDIKAANVLVTTLEQRAVPKIIDFGIAKAIHPPVDVATPETAFGQMLGTPEYMSPEQAVTGGKDVDIRTDVYSLGVLLYYLLSGRMPFPREGTGPVSNYELLAKIVSEDPPSLASQTQNTGAVSDDVLKHRNTKKAVFIKTLRGDLQWIVMKCLAKKRHDRYDSVSELAADLTRYLQHEPTLARPPELLDRFSKFCLRHKVGVVSGFVVGLALVAGVVGTTWGMMKAQAAERQAHAEADRALAAQRQASLQRNLALSTLEMLVRDVNDRLSARSDLNELRLALLDQAIEGLNKVTDLSGTDLSTEKNLIIGHQTISRIYMTARREREAQAHIEKAIASCLELFRQYPDDPELRILLARTYREAGALAHNHRLGDLDKAQQYFEKGLQILEQGDPAFRALLGTRNLLAYLYSELGDAQYDLSDLNGAAVSYQRSISLAEGCLKEDASDIDLAFLEVECLNGLGDVFIRQRDMPRAEEYYLEAARRLMAFPEKQKNTPKHKRVLALSHFNLGDVARALGDLDKSQTEFQTAEKLQRELLQIEPNHVQWRRDLFASVFRLGDLALDRGEPDRAVDFYFKAGDMVSELISMNPENSEAHRDLLICHIRVGDVFLKGREPRRSEKAYRAALAQAQWLRQSNSESLGNQMDYVMVLYKLCMLFESEDKWDQACAYARQGMTLFQALKDDGKIVPESYYASWEADFQTELDKCAD